jgi:hypothetical protein
MIPRAEKARDDRSLISAFRRRSLRAPRNRNARRLKVLRLGGSGSRRLLLILSIFLST